MSTTLPINSIIHGDCLQLLKQLPDNSVDCCVTDPPYGWKFMGKKWDYEIPGIPIWQEVYRVLKPGAHILAACGTRTQHRMAVNIEDAGFEIRDVICWHYGSGFPKSLDIGKAIDKAAGEVRITNTVMTGDICGGRYAGKGKSPRIEKRLTSGNPINEEAIKWNGWGTALKPSTEFWTLARKPISEKTIAQNVIKHGTGGLNINACRIETDWSIDPGFRVNGKKPSQTLHVYGKDTRKEYWFQNSERFPANTILDELLAIEMDRQSGLLTSGSKRPSHKNGTDQGNKKGSVFGVYKSNEYNIEANSGGASRFFYVAKPSPEERGDSTHPTVKPQTLIQYLIKLICPIEPGRIVLEPFAGSGSHCIAARKLGLDFIACELEEHSCKEANERLQKEMGLFH